MTCFEIFKVICVSYNIRDPKLHCALESFKELSKNRKYGVFRLHPDVLTLNLGGWLRGNSYTQKNVPRVGSVHLEMVLAMLFASYKPSLPFSLLRDAGSIESSLVLCLLGLDLGNPQQEVRGMRVVRSGTLSPDSACLPAA